jgi:hypothetical protein
MGPLTLLAESTGEFSNDIIGIGPNGKTVAINLWRPSGTTVCYQLELTSIGSTDVQVREKSPVHLPRQCPHRHINQDGWFCMNWQEGDPYPIVDAASARQWWCLLLAYLERQEAATRLGRWLGPTRAHGTAARHQSTAEEVAARLGAEFTRDFRAGAFMVRPVRRHGRNRIELFRNQRRVNRLALPGCALTNLRMACPCDLGRASGTQIGQCSRHAFDLAQFINAMYQWRKDELEFFRGLMKKGVACCRTLRKCLLT